MLLFLRLLQQLRQLPLPLLRGEAQRGHLLLVTPLGTLTALPEGEDNKHTDSQAFKSGDDSLTSECLRLKQDVTLTLSLQHGRFKSAVSQIKQLEMQNSIMCITDL